jgi:hypothetical protein
MRMPALETVRRLGFGASCINAIPDGARAGRDDPLSATWQRPLQRLGLLGACEKRITGISITSQRSVRSLKMKERWPAFRTIEGWARLVLFESAAIRRRVRDRNRFRRSRRTRGQQHRSAQLFGQGFETRSHVDRRTDDREVEPGARPDIAVHDVSDVDADAVIQRRTTAFAVLFVQGNRGPTGFGHSMKQISAGRRLTERKNGVQTSPPSRAIGSDIASK